MPMLAYVANSGLVALAGEEAAETGDLYSSSCWLGCHGDDG